MFLDIINLNEKNYLSNFNSMYAEMCFHTHIVFIQAITQYFYLVFVYLYGGGFINGNNMITEYGPDYYIDNGVIVVIPNYR